MYGIKDFAIPILGKWIGFDFEVYDFLPPHGSGKYRQPMGRLPK